MTEHYLNFLRWLSQHGIDPELPLILCSMAMGAMLAATYYKIKHLKENYHE